MPTNFLNQSFLNEATVFSRICFNRRFDTSTYNYIRQLVATEHGHTFVLHYIFFFSFVSVFVIPILQHKAFFYQIKAAFLHSSSNFYPDKPNVNLVIRINQNEEFKAQIHNSIQRIYAGGKVSIQHIIKETTLNILSYINE